MVYVCVSTGMGVIVLPQEASATFSKPFQSKVLGSCLVDIRGFDISGKSLGGSQSQGGSH